MAKRKRKAHRAASPRKRRRSVTRAAAPRRRRRRTLTSLFRRNPIGNLLGARAKISYQPKSLLSTAMHGAIDAGVGTAGMAIARLVRGKANIDGNTIKGDVVELGIGIAGAPLIAKFAGDDVARAFVQGVFMGPLMTRIKSKNIPVLSTALGDEGELPLFGGEYNDVGGTYEIGDGGGIGDETLLAGEPEYA